MQWEANLYSGLLFQIIHISEEGGKAHKKTKIHTHPHNTRWKNISYFCEKSAQDWDIRVGLHFLHWTERCWLWAKHHSDSWGRNGYQHLEAMKWCIWLKHCLIPPASFHLSLVHPLRLKMGCLSSKGQTSQHCQHQELHMDWQLLTKGKHFQGGFFFFFFNTLSKLVCTERSSRWSHSIWNNIKLAAQSCRGLSKKQGYANACTCLLKNLRRTMFKLCKWPDCKWRNAIFKPHAGLFPDSCVFIFNRHIHIC